jgi:hypothetical protein
LTKIEDGLMALEHVEAKKKVYPSSLPESLAISSGPSVYNGTQKPVHTYLHDGEGTWQEKIIAHFDLSAMDASKLAGGSHRLSFQTEVGKQYVRKKRLQSWLYQRLERFPQTVYRGAS